MFQHAWIIPKRGGWDSFGYHEGVLNDMDTTMTGIEVAAGTRLISRTRNHVIFERRFYSDDPLSCHDFAEEPAWWEFVISLRPPDETVLTCPRTRHSEIRWLHHHLVIQIRPDYLRELLRPEMEKVIPEMQRFVKSDEPIPDRLNLFTHTAALNAVIEQILNPPPVGSRRLFYEAKVRELVAHLCFAHPDVLPANDEARMQEALRYLQEHLNEPDALQGITRCLGCSTRQSQRIFRVAVGCSPSEYLTELRLKQAALLLTTTSLSVSEVALEVGYMSLSHFAKAFRMRFGHTPREFRKHPVPVWDAGDKSKV